METGSRVTFQKSRVLTASFHTEIWLCLCMYVKQAQIQLPGSPLTPVHMRLWHSRDPAGRTNAGGANLTVRREGPSHIHLSLSCLTCPDQMLPFSLWSLRPHSRGYTNIFSAMIASETKGWKPQQRQRMKARHLFLKARRMVSLDSIDFLLQL